MLRAGLRPLCVTLLGSILAVPAGADGRFRPDGPQIEQSPMSVWPAVAPDASGNFVMAWVENNMGVFAQLFDPHGAPRAGAFQVDPTVQSTAVRVACLPDGAFMVVWLAYELSGTRYGVYYAAYDASGQAAAHGLLADVVVPAFTYTPATVAASTGRFLAAWQENQGISARVFDAAGVPQGAPFRVDIGGSNSRHPLAATDPLGGFVVGWESGASSAARGFARRFEADGSPAGTVLDLGQAVRGICADSQGGLITVRCAVTGWPSGDAIVVATRLAADGTPLWGPLDVSGGAAHAAECAPGTPGGPQVACDARGSFVATWLSPTPTVLARRFRLDGAPDSPPFRVNNLISARAAHPSVAANAQGDFAVAWEGGQTWPTTRARAQRFLAWPPVVKGDFDRDGHADLVLRRLQDGRARIWYMREAVRGSNALVRPATPDWAWTLAAVDDFNADGVPDLVFRAIDSGAVAVWLLGGQDGAECIGGGTLSGAPLPSNEWDIVASADFDRDGQPDLLWRNRLTYKLAVWLLDGVVWRATVVPNPDAGAGADWQVVAAGDFNGDTNVDLLWYDRASGRVVQWLLDAALVRSEGRFINPAQAGDRNWEVVAAGDYGFGLQGQAGTYDLVWRNASSGSLVVWFMDCAGSRTGGTYTTPQAPADPLAWTVVGPR